LKLIPKMGLIIFITFASFCIYLWFFPIMENNFLTSATITMAIATFIMACITYISYDKLITIQKATFEPALSVSLWKKAYQVENPKELRIYMIRIKNDGPGMAKNVTLETRWASIKKTKDTRNRNHEFKEEDLAEQYDLDIGNIAPKEKQDVSQIPIPLLAMDGEVYGIKIKATCEDMFGNRMEKYSDIKRLNLFDAEIRKLE